MNKKFLAVLFAFLLILSIPNSLFASEIADAEQNQFSIQNKSAEQLQDFLNNYDDVEYVNYSMDYLKKIVADITPHLEELGLLGVGIDEENNCIVIDANINNDESVIRENLSNSVNPSYLKSHSINDDNLFVINKTDLTLQNTATVKLVQK